MKSEPPFPMLCYTLPVIFSDWLEEGVSIKTCRLFSGSWSHDFGSSSSHQVYKTCQHICTKKSTVASSFCCFLIIFILQKYSLPVVPYKNLISYIRKLTGCHPLAQSLFQLLCKNETVTRTQKVICLEIVLYRLHFFIWCKCLCICLYFFWQIAVVEGLYALFREILPKLGSKQGERIIEDLDVFENSTYCWTYLISEAKVFPQNLRI